MTFYSYNYLVHQNNNHTLVQLAAIGIININNRHTQLVMVPP
ncbi:DUF3290 domain-containing protein [Lactiplantibacillus plantarum]|nr:DUF3290 domain-containing protein [Lactiplantibacillus plantarum]